MLATIAPWYINGTIRGSDGRASMLDGGLPHCLPTRLQARPRRHRFETVTLQFGSIATLDQVKESASASGETGSRRGVGPMVPRKTETFEPVTLGHIRSHGCRDLLVY